MGKHCWNFLVNPDSLVARVFKARYFPNSSLMNAKRGGGSSFIWSGIWQAKEAMRNGYRWVLGDGQSIDVFEDAWLRGKVDFRVEASIVNRESTVKAKDLFVPNIKAWDVQKVNSLFPSCDAKAILATPIPQTQEVDRLAWTQCADGKYSVKKGYQYWQNTITGTISRGVGWSQLWRLEIPQKVKVFL